MKPFGLHLSNNRPLEQYHWDIIARVQPGIVVVCEPYFSDVPRLREVVPGITIIGRMYGDQSLGISNWSRPDDRALANMTEFGRRSGHKANQYGIDIMTPFNEPSIDMGIPTTPDGFSLIAQIFIDWLIGYHQVTTRKAGTIGLAPGNREDDYGFWGYRGADILRPAFELADVLLLHNYWNHGTDTYGVPLVQSEWEGNRASRQLPAYGWTKEWAIKECNRPLKEDSEKAEIAEQSRTFIAQHAAKPGFLGACWFILDSADDQFREHRMVNNDYLIDTAISINAATPQQEEPTMPKPTSLSINALPPVRPGDSLAVSGNASGIDGVAMLTARIALPAKPDGYAYGADTVASGIPIAPDGSFLFPIQIPTVTENLDARLILNTVELDPSAGAFDAAEASFPVKIIANASEVPWTPQPVALPPAYDIMFQRAGDVINAAEAVGDTELAELGRDIHRTIDRRKAGQ